MTAISLPTDGYDVVGSIVLFNTPTDEIARAIEQFLAVPLKTHLCVIDNSPRPLSFSLGSTAVSYHFPGTNLGYGRAHNLALRAASGKARYNLIMNTDVQYSKSAVLKLFDFLQKHAKAGLAAPKMLNPDGSLQYVCRLLPTPKDFFLRRFMPTSRWTCRSDYNYELRFWDHDSYASLPYFQGSFLMVRTDLCNEIGGFDERFFMYGEDIDLCRRLYSRSETVYVPDAHVLHEYRRYSSKSLRGTWIGIQNNARYFNKWGWFVDKDRARINESVMLHLRNSSTQSPGNKC